PMIGALPGDIQLVVLRNMRNRAVAFGRIDNRIPNPSVFSHLVEIDEVLDGTEQLIDRIGTLAEIRKGQKIEWPMHSVTFM
ncbi:hypothetical protein MKW94_009621, partial [Papaver nudicaule]|nr:hypothetical protein [Papaver nudicaule]MCL7051562.1 hypothetical protein [Papaver nudicaule]